ncbi:MAG: B12-binding domain-containing radical SAM protein [Victivallaceae bacterium]
MSNVVKTDVLSSVRKKIFRLIIPGFPTFNIYSSVAKYTTALGPVMIATVISKMPGWEVEIIDENNYHGQGPKGENGRPDHNDLQQLRRADVAGFYGGLTSTATRLYELSRFYKEQGAVTIAGGQHFVGENLNEGLSQGIDYLVIGEGEVTIRELFDVLTVGGELDKVAGIAFLRDGKLIQTAEREDLKDIDRLPLPDFSLLRHARVKLFPVSWERGCGMNCEFCTVKGRVRCPSPDYVMDQICSIFERYNATYFFIVDDLFGQNRLLALDFCERLRKYQDKMGVKFFITVQIRLDKAKDLELLKAMQGAGVRVVAIGYESPIPEELKAMNKKLHPDEMIANTKIFHKAGFMVHGMFIFGYPAREGQAFVMSAENRVKAFWKFIRKARIDTIQILLPVPLPGTELTKRLADQGRIFPKEIIDWKYYDGNFPLFTPDYPLTAEDMHLANKALMGHFYQFRYVFSIGLDFLLFPMILFPFFNVKDGWRKWYHSWRNNVWRFIGWNILRKWTSHRNRDNFSARLEQVEKTMPQSFNAK